VNRFVAANEHPRVGRRQFLSQLAMGGSAVAVGASLSEVWAGDAAKPAAMAQKPTALVFDEICKSHLTGPDEPECPQRYDALMASLGKSSFYPALVAHKPRPATDDEVRLCHTPGYLELARREIESGAQQLSTGDTCVCSASLTAARIAAGGACIGVDLVVGGQAKNAFCLSRPPGHHATPDRGMGFCIFNNVAVAARYAQRKHGLGKVLVIDWDVHHGNGTQDIFYEDPSVLFFSTHQAPWYPWTGDAGETGRGKGLGTTINCPLARGAGRKEFLAAFEGQLAPVVGRFKPELILLSAGFDARHGDPLGKLELTDDDYRELTGIVLDMAQAHAGGRVVSVLEGGYSLTGLAAAATAHCQRLQQG
jgi:acetoin utilization deacetylase AcuC-like enzyme